MKSHIHIEVGSKQTIINATKEEVEFIKEDLTFENPKHKSAMKYSGYSFTRIPKYLTFYKRIKTEYLGKEVTALEVPRFFNIKKCLEKRGIETSLIGYHFTTDKKTIIYPTFKMELRKNQNDAIEAYLREFNTTLLYPKSIIQLPTGKGKTILAIHLASRIHAKTIVLVHKTDLVVGWTKDIKQCFDDIDVGIIQAGKKHISDFITIATFQTLHRMSEEERQELFNSFDLVIFDECLRGDTYVSLSDGGVSEIENCFSFNEVLGGKVSRPFKRKSKIWELRCSHAIIEGSPTHKTWCIKKGSSDYKYQISDCVLKTIQELDDSYLVPVRYTLPHTVKNNTSPTFARFLAVIQCDGHLDKLPSHRVKINIKKDFEFYKGIFTKGCKEYHLTMKYSIDIRGNHTFWFNDLPFKEYLQNECNCPFGKKSALIEIPKFMFYAPLETIKAYIETCFNCEGDLSLDKNSWRINFVTCSKKFAQGLNLLLKKFGVLSCIQHIYRTKENCSDCYRLSVSGVFFNKFMDQFNLIDRKSTLGRNKIVYTNRFDGDYYFSKVISSDFTGEEDYVYDFTVEESHSFIANGLYTHNCHHLNPDMFGVIDEFNSRYKLGLSATPVRSDGMNYLFDIYLGGLVYQYEYTEDEEDICGAQVIITPTKYRYRPFIYEGRVFNYYSFSEDELPEYCTFVEDLDYSMRPKIPHQQIDSDRVNDPKFMFKVCKQILNEYRQGRSILALFNLKEDVRVYQRFLSNFIPKNEILLYYGDSKDKVDVMLEKAESKECHITFATYSKAKEGTNVKAWEVLFLVSSINDAKNTEQAVGRIRRKSDDKLDMVRIYDYPATDVYSMGRHIRTRLEVYKKLHFTGDVNWGQKSRDNLFSRGY